MGGTQNIEVNFEITPLSNGEYILNTTMYINDWYGADEDDISSHIDYKSTINNIINTAILNPVGAVININNLANTVNSRFKSIIPGLDDLFWLQHHYGCKPFPTQIIWKSTDKIKIDR